LLLLTIAGEQPRLYCFIALLWAAARARARARRAVAGWPPCAATMLLGVYDGRRLILCYLLALFSASTPLLARAGPAHHHRDEAAVVVVSADDDRSSSSSSSSSAGSMCTNLTGWWGGNGIVQEGENLNVVKGDVGHGRVNGHTVPAVFNSLYPLMILFIRFPSLFSSLIQMLCYR
jgi:hypothetical protein